MSKQKVAKIVVVLLCSISELVIFYLEHILFYSILSPSIYWVNLLFWCLLYFQMTRSTSRNISRILILVLSTGYLLCCFLFLLKLPTYSYNGAKKLLNDHLSPPAVSISYAPNLSLQYGVYSESGELLHRLYLFYCTFRDDSNMRNIYAVDPYNGYIYQVPDLRLVDMPPAE